MMTAPEFCNTTSGNYAIFRQLIKAGHLECTGFFSTGTGDVICECGKRLSLAELSAAPLAEVVS